MENNEKGFDEQINDETIQSNYLIKNSPLTYSKKTLQKMYDMAKKQGLEAVKDFVDLINTGKVGNFDVNAISTNHNDFEISFDIRIAYGNILAESYENFKLLKDNGIDLFHGTNINALPGILKDGTRTVGDMIRSGEEVSTGESFTRLKDLNRGFVSLANDPDIAARYSRLDSTSDKNTGKDFGIMLGYSSKDLENLKVNTMVSSEVPELAINETIPKEFLKFIAVSKENAEFVRELVGDNKDIKVVEMDLGSRFYEIESPKPQAKAPKFEKEDLRKENEKASSKGLRAIFDKIKNMMTRGKDKADKEDIGEEK